MNRICYISRCYRDRRSAGNRAKTDNEVTFAEMGAVNLGLPQRIRSGKVATFVYDLMSVVRFAFKVRRSDRLLLQYPVKKYYTLICRIAHSRGAKVVSFIHDLGSCRRKKLTVEQEMRRLSHSDAVIAANPAMQAWLEVNGYKGILTCSGFHDYRSNAQPNEESGLSTPPTVIYAGAVNRRKNSFLIDFCQLHKSYRLLIYGDCRNIPEIVNSQTETRDFIEPDMFISNAGGDYGLVWDGDSLDACTGSFGEYLALNTPHKASFYLRAGLPLIVWDNSAIAPLVKHEGVGIAVSSLADIDNALARITDDAYSKMRRNVVALSKKLSAGDSLRAAIDYSLKKLDI